MGSVSQYSTVVSALQSARASAERSVSIECAEKEKIEKKLEALLEVQEVAQEVAQAVQQKAHQKIASVVTRCLRSVFGEEAYEFKIDFERKRGKTEARMYFERDGLQVDPLSASGGGPVDVAAFALRLASLVLTRPIKRKILVLDEPLKYPSREYWHFISEMLRVVSEEMGVQIIMVTHQEGLVSGKVIRIEK